MKKALLALVALLVLASPWSVLGATGITYTSGFQVQNLSQATASIAVDFYDQNGASPAGSQITDQLLAGQMKIYYPLPGSVPTGFNGSAVVSSDQQVAAITNVLGNGGQRGDSYAGFAAGGNLINIPLVMRGNYGNDTWINVQNTGTADATVSIAYTPGTCTDSAVIKPNAAHTFDQATTPCLPASRFLGAAIITSNQPVAAVVMEVGNVNLLSYSGWLSTDAAGTLVMPLVMTNNYGNFTSISVQNAGSTGANVTVSYAPVSPALGNACTETQSVAKGAMATFGYPSVPAACLVNGKFVGSATVTSAQPLVAIVNQVNANNGNASAYNAFNPAKATGKVSLPLIMDRNYGLYTSVSVVNVGTSATSVNCTFTNTGYTISAASLAPGASITELQLNQIADKYTGAGTCLAGTGGKIAATVNQIKPAAASQDVLFTYPGFNY